MASKKLGKGLATGQSTEVQGIACMMCTCTEHEQPVLQQPLEFGCIYEVPFNRYFPYMQQRISTMAVDHPASQGSPSSAGSPEAARLTIAMNTRDALTGPTANQYSIKSYNSTAFQTMNPCSQARALMANGGALFRIERL